MNYLMSVTLKLNDLFTSGVKSAKSSFAGMKGALGQIADNPMNRLAADLAQANNLTQPLRDSLNRAMEEPSKKAKELEKSMAAVHSVLNEQNSIAGDIELSYNRISLAADRWASGLAKNSEIATRSSKNFGLQTYSMISAGLNTEAAISGTGASLILGKGTKGENVSGNMLARSYNILGKKGDDVDTGEEMMRLADIIAKAQGLFQLDNLGQLDAGAKNAFAAASEHKIDASQFYTMLGQFNSLGMTDSVAGTGINQMMAKMLTASKKLGFDISFTESGNTDVIQTIENIRNQLGPLSDMSDSMKIKFTQAFGEEGKRGVGLLVSSLDSLKSNYDQILNSQGAAVEMATRMSNTFADKEARAANLTEVWQTKIGKSTNRVKGFFLDVKIGAMQALNPLLESKAGDKLADIAAVTGLVGQKFLNFTSGALQVSSQLATISSMASNAGGYMNMFKNTMMLVKAPFSMLIRGGGMMVRTLFSLGRGIIMMIPRLFMWAGGMIAAAWPVIAIVAGIALLTTGIILLIKNWSKVGPFFMRVGNKIKMVFFKVVDFVKSVFIGGFKFLTAPLRNFITFFKVLFTEGFTGVKKRFLSFIKWIPEQLSKIPLIGKLFEGKEKEGERLVSTMAAGVDKSNALYSATNQQFNKVDSLIPHSDAKEGPFSRLTAAGKAIPETMAKGAKTGKLKTVLHDVFNMVKLSGNPGGSGSTPQSIHIENLTIQAEELETLLDLWKMLLKKAEVI